MKYLGSLRGEGELSTDAEHGPSLLGEVTYEIEGYDDRSRRSAAGRVEGDARTLTRAYAATHVHLRLADHPASIEVVLSDPKGGTSAEVTVAGQFPL